MIIGVTGPSGVGKTTVSQMLSLILGYKKTLIVSGDDLHRWKRGDNNWKKYTHLNPAANNLSKGAADIKSLRENKCIYRKLYNHDAGDFTDLMKISPRKNVIYEGLHALYNEDIRSLFDFSIYIETDIELKKAWKMKRDTKKRGYTIEQVLNAINKRVPDELKYITPQKKYASAVIEFNKNGDKVELSYRCNDLNNKHILDELVELYNKYQEFLDISEKIYSKKTLSPNKGGNMSFIWNNVLSITSSGIDFGDVELFNGYTRCDVDTLKKIFSTESRPSMEAPVHIKMGKNVLHTHPSNVLAILCCKEAPEILNEIFEKMPVILDYCTPGKQLSNSIDGKDNIVFARNHGLFVSSEKNLKECYEITCEIEDRCQRFFRETMSKKYLFPDAYVLKEENDMLHSFVRDRINEAGLTPLPLSQEHVAELERMEEEKYRRQK